MHHFILIFGFVLLPKVATLKCYECSDTGDCSNTVQECPASNARCGVSRITSYVDTLKISDVTMKSCTESKRCVDSSANFGALRSVITSKCCTSDLCNTQSVPEPARSSPNGRKCHTCSEQSCNQILNCEGNEDHCISASVTLEGQMMTIKGCASANFCTNITTQIIKNFGTELTCCQGDYCNSASTSITGRASLLLLVAPFIPLITFS